MSITLESLNEKIVSMQLRLDALENMPKAAKTPKATKAPKDPDAPKKEANWFVKSLGSVRETLKPLIEAHNSALAEGSKKITGVCATQVGRILKEDGLMAKEIQPTVAQIQAAFATFLTAPLPTKTEEWKAGSKKPSPASSVASAGTAKPAAKPKAELSEEEAAAKRSAKAAKAAATRAANKAKKAAEAEAEAEAVPEPEAEAEVIETEEVTMDIGKGSKKYERIVHQGITYIYTADGDTFLGEWNEATKKLNPAGKDIKAA